MTTFNKTRKSRRKVSLWLFENNGQVTTYYSSKGKLKVKAYISFPTKLKPGQWYARPSYKNYYTESHEDALAWLYQQAIKWGEKNNTVFLNDDGIPLKMLG